MIAKLLRLSSLALLPGLLVAQSPVSVRHAVSSITPADIIKRIGILAHDSMLGRATPSPQIEQVARYIAGEFRRLGLKPGGDSGTFIQHYPIVRRQLDTAQSVLTLAGPRPVTLKLGQQVSVVRFGLPSPGGLSGPVVLLAGPPDSTNPFRGANVRGAWVALVVTAGPVQLSLNGALGWSAVRAGALGVLVISNRSDEQWEDQLRRVVAPSYAFGAATGQGGGGGGGGSAAPGSWRSATRRLPGLSASTRRRYAPR